MRVKFRPLKNATDKEFEAMKPALMTTNAYVG